MKENQLIISHPKKINSNLFIVYLMLTLLLKYYLPIIN